MDSLGQALDKAGDADLVDHLGELAGTGGAKQLAHPGVRRDHGLSLFVGGLSAAAHHGQHAVFCASLAAGDRCIDELKAALGRLRVELPGNLGRSGGVIDKNGAGLHARERAVGTDRDRAQVVIVADAGHHEILAFRRGLRRGGRLAAEFPGPGLRFCRVAIVHRDVMTTFGNEMPRHGESHDAETEKCDFCHSVRSLNCWVLTGFSGS